MIPQTTGANGRPHDRVVSITSAKNKKHAAGTSKTASRAAPAGREPGAEPVLGKRILEAFKEDSNPSKSLAEIRELLIGPVSKLHEARMEELVSILEESDRSNQVAIKELGTRCDSLSKTCEHLIAALNDTNDLLQRQSEQQTADLQKQAKAHGEAMAETVAAFESNVQKLTNDQNYRIDGLATKMANDYQALVANVTMRIDDLAQATSANDDRIVSNFEAMLAHSDANSEHMRSKQIETFAEGFNDFADRILALRGSKTK
jgi:hypothetical protein